MASSLRRFLVTAGTGERMSLWAAMATVSNWIEGRGPEERQTWLVMVIGDGADAFLGAARTLGVTVEELEGAGDEEHRTLLVGEPGTGWKPTTCEHRHPDEDPCGAQAAYTVSVGQRKHDARASCRRHLAATVDMLRRAECRDAEIAVRVIRRG